MNFSPVAYGSKKILTSLHNIKLKLKFLMLGLKQKPQSVSAVQHNSSNSLVSNPYVFIREQEPRLSSELSNKSGSRISHSIIKKSRIIFESSSANSNPKDDSKYNPNNYIFEEDLIWKPTPIKNIQPIQVKNNQLAPSLQQKSTLTYETGKDEQSLNIYQNKNRIKIHDNTSIEVKKIEFVVTSEESEFEISPKKKIPLEPFRNRRLMPTKLKKLQPGIRPTVQVMLKESASDNFKEQPVLEQSNSVPKETLQDQLSNYVKQDCSSPSKRYISEDEITSSKTTHSEAEGCEQFGFQVEDVQIDHRKIEDQLNESGVMENHELPVPVKSESNEGAGITQKMLETVEKPKLIEFEQKNLHLDVKDKPQEKLNNFSITSNFSPIPAATTEVKALDFPLKSASIQKESISSFPIKSNDNQSGSIFLSIVNDTCKKSIGEAPLDSSHNPFLKFSLSNSSQNSLLTQIKPSKPEPQLELAKTQSTFSSNPFQFQGMSFQNSTSNACQGNILSNSITLSQNINPVSSLNSQNNQPQMSQNNLFSYNSMNTGIMQEDNKNFHQNNCQLSSAMNYQTPFYQTNPSLTSNFSALSSSGPNPFMVNSMASNDYKNSSGLFSQQSIFQSSSQASYRSTIGNSGSKNQKRILDQQMVLGN